MNRCSSPPGINFPPGVERVSGHRLAGTDRAQGGCGAGPRDGCARRARSARRCKRKSRFMRPRAQAARFAAMRDELRFLLITSQARVVETEHAARIDGAEQRNPECGSRSNPAASPSACAAGICAATSAAIRGTRSFARAVSSTSRDPVRSGNSHDNGTESCTCAAVAVVVGCSWCWRTRSARRISAGHFLEFEFMRVLPVLDITCMHNVGAAFSFLASASGWQRWLFIGLAAVVSIGMTIWLLRLPRGTPALLAAGLALVLGGALGNLIDRIRLGYRRSISFTFIGNGRIFPHSTWLIRRLPSAPPVFCWMPCSKRSGRPDANLIGQSARLLRRRRPRHRHRRARGRAVRRTHLCAARSGAQQVRGGPAANHRRGVRR